MKILLTGGAGFIGSALCHKLSQLGHKVVAFDNFSRKSHINTKNLSYETCEGDVRDLESLKTVARIHRFDSLWHFAYINGTSTFYSHPELVLDVGVKGAINTLDIALALNIENYVLASTSEVYNEPTEIPTTEEEKILIPDIHNPRFSYSGGKIISELLAIHYGAKQGLNVKIMRPHNVYGPNMGFEHVIPELIGKMVVPENPQYVDEKLVVNIQGSGSETRAFCYIDDAVDEMILTGINSKSDDHTIYNIGVEKETSVTQLANAIAGTLDKEIVINPGNKAAGSSNRRCPSMKKMCSLGHTPKHTLQSGLSHTVPWYKEFYLSKRK